MNEIERIADDLACELGTVGCPNRQTLAEHIAAALIAAEERGRRRGVEERDELRACLELARGFVAFQYARNPIPYNEEALARIVKALAPRDSAPKHKDWCALFGNPEAGKSCDCRGERK